MVPATRARRCCLSTDQGASGRLCGADGPTLANTFIVNRVDTGLPSPRRTAPRRQVRCSAALGTIHVVAQSGHLNPVDCTALLPGSAKPGEIARADQQRPES